MNALLTQAFTEPDRWRKAIQHGLDKGIDRATLTALCDERTRTALYLAIRDGQYNMLPPHTAQIPKRDIDPATGLHKMRTVYVSEAPDRVLGSLAYDLLMDTCRDMIHPTCQSYQPGISCGKVVKEFSRDVIRYTEQMGGHHVQVGFKSDLSKYFDSVPVEYIDAAFDVVITRYGDDALIECLRHYYHDDRYLDYDKDTHQWQVKHLYMSLRQGCAVAAWLADVVLYHIDERISQLNVKYVRYSDDILCVGPDYQQAFSILTEELDKMGMKLNPKKVEPVTDDRWINFLGYSVKGAAITLSSCAIESIREQIEAVTLDRIPRNNRDPKPKLASVVAAVHRILYRGFKDYSWATRVLRTVNVKEDLLTLDEWIRDCIRATQTGHRRVGGIGWDRQRKVGCIARGRGQHVTNNHHAVPHIEGYHCIPLMAGILRASRAAYDTTVKCM